MRFAQPGPRAWAGVWLASTLVLAACTNQLPTFIEEDEIIAVEIPNNCSAMNVGQTCTLTARALTDGGQEVPGARLQWRSDAPDVAAVEGSRNLGVVSAIGDGTATIVATVPGTQIQGQAVVRVVASQPGNPPASLGFLQFDVVPDATEAALSGSLLVRSLREFGVTVESFAFEAAFQDVGDPGPTRLEVSSCTLLPEAPPARVTLQTVFEFVDCDLERGVPAGATFLLTVFVQIEGEAAPLEISAMGAIP